MISPWFYIGIYLNKNIQIYKNLAKINKEYSILKKSIKNSIYDSDFRETKKLRNNLRKKAILNKNKGLTSPKELITQKGHTVPTLNLIYNGTVDVVVDDKKVAELKDGQFVGEMSFLTEKPATATCVVKHDTELLVWKQDQFKELLKRNP